MSSPRGRRCFLLAAGSLALLLLLVASANLYVTTVTRQALHDDLETLPQGYDIALLLGTGIHNDFFEARVAAAARLYHAGKVRHILCTGANPTPDYNESLAMRERLAALGVPREATTLDFAGRRTLDSVLRARDIFGVERCLIVSQRFHNYRAVLQARHHGITALAYNADNPPRTRDMARAHLRETLARVLVLADLHLLDRQAQILGSPEPIKLPPLPVPPPAP